MAVRTIHIPWYATLFRADKFETALLEIAPVALRYGARDWSVIRYSDDTYKFVQVAGFERKSDFESYWYGEEFTRWRADYQSWYQVPVVYAPAEVIGEGRMAAAGNGAVATG